MKTFLTVLFVITLLKNVNGQNSFPATGPVNIGGPGSTDVPLWVYKDYGLTHSGQILRVGGKTYWETGTWEEIQLGFTQFRSIYEGNSLWGMSISTGLSDGTGTEAFRISGTGNVGIGTSSIPNGYKLAVNGNMIAESIMVKLNANWPDYVFHKTYSLRPLSEVEKYIKLNRHLPEIPSAKEIDKEGVNLGEMNAMLLKKIEELTLYLIEQNKKQESLSIEVKQLKSKIDQLTSKP